MPNNLLGYEENSFSNICGWCSNLFGAGPNGSGSLPGSSDLSPRRVHLELFRRCQSKHIDPEVRFFHHLRFWQLSAWLECATLDRLEIRLDGDRHDSAVHAS